MPKARAPKAPWVEVWLSPQTMVMPGLGQPELGPDDVDDALVGVAHRVAGDPELGAVGVEDLELPGRDRVGDGLVDVGGRDVVVGGGHGELGMADRPARQPQAVEGLRRRDLVDQVQVDEEQVGLTVGVMDEVAFPHLVAEACCGAHQRSTADLDDLDPQGAARRLVLDDVARGLAQQGLAQRGAGGDHVELVVALLDRSHQEPPRSPRRPRSGWPRAAQRAGPVSEPRPRRRSRRGPACAGAGGSGTPSSPGCPWRRGSRRSRSRSPRARAASMARAISTRPRVVRSSSSAWSRS